MNTSRESGVIASDAFQRYIDHAQSCEWSDFGSVTRRRAVLVLADNLASICGAMDEPEIALFREQQLQLSSCGDVSVFTRGRPRTDTQTAAMINGLAMGWNETDEGYRLAVCHAGLCVLPALLAVAEAKKYTVLDLLRALILGYDTVARIARTWRFTELKLHPHAVLAPVGAAAAVGYLSRFSSSELVGGISGACAMGMTGPFNQATQGILIRNAWASHGAVTGLHALAYARAGIGGHGNTPRDVYLSLGATEDLAQLDPVLNPGFAIDQGYHKIHACCQYTHSAIEAVQTLLSNHPQLRDEGAISKISVQVHALGHALNDAHPHSTLGAKFSIPHAVAAAFIHGHGGVPAFNTQAIRSAAIAELRSRVVLELFPETRPWPEDRPARVIVTTRTGQQYAATCWSAQGGPDRPYSEEQIWNKIQTLCQPQIPTLTRAMQHLLALVENDDLPAMQMPCPGLLDSLFMH